MNRNISMRQSKLLVIGIFAVGFLLSLAANNVSAQTYTDLHSFNCVTEGCYPQYPAILAQGRDGNLYGTSWWGGTAQYGAVFRVTPSGTLTTLSNLDCTSAGCSPYGGLSLGTDGNLYGANYEGGQYGYGTIFKITPSATLTVLHQFDGIAPDWGSPWAPPVQGKDGNYYGTAAAYVAYKITAAGKFSVISNSVPAAVSAPLIQATDGYFYGTSNNGGARGCGVVFRMSAAGVIKTIYEFDYTHGCFPFAGLVQGTDGNFYGTTAYGGSAQEGVVYKVTPGGVLTVLHEFADTVAPDPFAGLVLATDGNFYGATDGGGAAGYGVLFKITKTGTYTALYEVPQGYTGHFPYATPVQHTNGKIYGLMYAGGSNNEGTFYSLDVGLGPFAKLMTTQGKAGQVVEILGQGFTGTTSVMFGTGSASFTIVSDTYMTAKVPVTGTTGYVTVTTPSGTLTSNRIFKVVPTTAVNITLTSSPNPSYVDQQVTFSVVVSASGATPTGSVTFMQGTTILGTSTLVNGKTNLLYTFTTAGSVSIIASYSGDQNYPAKNSMALKQTINKYTTSTALTSNLNPSTYGQAVTLTATVSSAGPTPTGTVTFKNGSATLGSRTLNAGGVATLTSTKIPVGTDSLTATYNGDVLNGKSVSAAITQTVSQASLSMVLTSTPNPSTFGKSVKFTAKLTSNGGLPSGQPVTFSYNGATLGTANVTSTGVATFSTTTLPQGSDVVTAAYAGCVDYSSASATVTQVVN